ncbi:MAG TPA: RecQ family ATP-dependent DNA helicase [Anaerolineae bacterium]|nr:RecQ family ATP-dependent DNA helicase [Anaerolineae bacterium]
MGHLREGAVHLTCGERVHLTEALHHQFGHTDFRPGQAEVVSAILRGESVLAVMPTGAGKSLCYQLAGMLLPGTALVISPLIALMKDQLDGLPADVARHATLINSSLDGRLLASRMEDTARGAFKLVYAAPERLRQVPFLNTLKHAGVSLLVVDEAHCVSLWGHDFRPDYLFISKAWQELGKPPILAMTATATPHVRADIQAALGKMRLIATDIHRPNLQLEVQRLSTEQQKRQLLRALCREMEGSGIVYAMSRQRCEELATMLERDGESVMYYHAGIEERAAAQDRFMRGQARIVVATVAFGMGVDKEDVRFIIHYDLPRALENYHQEVGRAGRDGLPARCVLLFSESDFMKRLRLAQKEALTPEWLLSVHQALRKHMGADSVGIVALGDLERDLATDEVPLRVAIQFLETAGWLWRGLDLPRAVSLRLLVEPDSRGPELARFAEAARLRRGEALPRATMDLCRAAGLDPRTVEARLLEWSEAGWMQYRGSGRDMLLALPESPPGGLARLAALLAEYNNGQEARIRRLAAYARIKTCRHGHIASYFGSRPVAHCDACDNCLAGEPNRIPGKEPPARVPASQSGKVRSAGQGQAPGKPSTSPGRRPPDPPAPFDPALADALRAWRKREAHSRGLPAFCVLHDSVLLQIAARMPASPEQLRRIKGIGPQKLETYGQDILHIVASHRRAKDQREKL